MIMHGVYGIRNQINQKCYIGSASGKSGFQQRWWNHRHLLRHNRHHSLYLQRAWNKYGEEAFVFEILLICDPENCLMYEQIALDHYQPEYNICKIAGSPLGRQVSSATRQKLSESQSGSKHHLYGKKRSLETCRKISLSNRGSNNSEAKLDERKVRIILRALSLKIKGVKLAKRFGVSTSTISEIKHGKRFKHVT